MDPPAREGFDALVNNEGVAMFGPWWRASCWEKRARENWKAAWEAKNERDEARRDEIKALDRVAERNREIIQLKTENALLKAERDAVLGDLSVIGVRYHQAVEDLKKIQALTRGYANPVAQPESDDELCNHCGSEVRSA